MFNNYNNKLVIMKTQPQKAKLLPKQTGNLFFAIFFTPLAPPHFFLVLLPAVFFTDF